MEFLYVIQQAIIWVLTIFWLYQIMVSICSLVKLKDKPLKIEKNHKFMAIIPAHNEEAVVANLVESLKNQNYDKNLLDIYVIADNCTDNTAQIAKDAGAIVYERFDANKKTKGYALNWFLKQKIEEKADYDAFFVFDADNIVDKDFIKNMNKKLCQGEDVVQGYRDIKNPTDNWITAGYAIFYWTMHRLYHLSRYNLGLSALLNGTGFMVRFDIIKPNGWDTETLTEDIEFSLKRIIEGSRVGWATDAIVYDEQPTGFKQSWSQRSRWTVGHIITTLALLAINMFIYLAGQMSGAELLLNYAMYIVPTFFLPILLAVFIMKLDGRPLKPMAKQILCYPFFMATWIAINFKCLFKRETTWEKIEHNRNIKITDVTKANKVETVKVTEK